MKSFVDKLISKKISDDNVADHAFIHALVMSVIGIAVCMLCLVGLTWAWFQSSVSSGSTTISAGNFDFTITVVSEDIEGEIVPVNGVYTLNPSKTTTITLTKSSSGTSSGFCHVAVTLPGKTTSSTYFTGSIPYNGGSYVFKITGFEKIQLTPMWGTPDSTSIIEYNATLKPVTFTSISPVQPDVTQQTDNGNKTTDQNTVEEQNNTTPAIIDQATDELSENVNETQSQEETSQQTNQQNTENTTEEETSSGSN